VSAPIARDTRRGGPGGARDREAYFLAAYELLGEAGCDAITIAGMCERLHVTKGSFYHHFTDMAAFNDAFVERWVLGMRETIAAHDAEPDPGRRLELIANSVELMGKPESGLRGWARTHPALAAALEDLVAQWNDLVARTAAQIVGDPARAAVLQLMSLCIGTGIALRTEPFDIERFLRVEQVLARRCFGLEADLVTVDGRPTLTFRPDRSPGPPPAPALPDLDAMAWAEDRDWVGPTATQPGRRIRGRTPWFGAALELLGEHGPDGITVAALCNRLSVTKGSFHWHFEGMPQFLAALAEHWQGLQETRLAEDEAQPDALARLQCFHQRLLTARDPAETAWRARAHTEAVIADAVRRVDRRRQAMLAITIGEVIADPDVDLLAEITLGLGIGLRESEQPQLTPDMAVRIVVEWLHVLRLDTDVRVEEGRPVLVLVSQR
jgi:AcrR family transcriptional regulator